jgi:hypothetical protein
MLITRRSDTQDFTAFVIVECLEYTDPRLFTEPGSEDKDKWVPLIDHNGKLKIPGAKKTHKRY